MFCQARELTDFSLCANAKGRPMHSCGPLGEVLYVLASPTAWP